MLSKEAGVLVPVLILFYELLIRTKNGFKLSQIYSLLYFAIPALIYLSLRRFVAQVIVREEIGITSFFQNIYILFEYLAKTVYFFYIDPLPVKNNTLIIIGIVTFIGIILFLVFNRKEKIINTFLFGLLMFLIIVLPTLFVRVNADDGVFNYIDCRMYLPLVGLTISLAVIFGKFSVVLEKSYKVVLVSTLFIYLISFTFLHSTVYKNGLSYWMTALEKNPDRATYWMGLGYYYLDHKMYSEAIQCASTAINLKPNIDAYYLKAAFACEASGELEKAIDFLERGMKTENSKSINLVLLVKIYLKLGNKEKADEYATKFAQLDISDNKKKSDELSSIAYYYSYSNHFSESISWMKNAITLAPDIPSLKNDLGLFYYKIAEIDSAKKYVTEALQLDPLNSNFKKNLEIINK
jgi:tetratricopeptide (TPR) repeat protein